MWHYYLPPLSSNHTKASTRNPNLKQYILLDLVKRLDKCKSTSLRTAFLIRTLDRAIISKKVMVKYLCIAFADFTILAIGNIFCTFFGCLVATHNIIHIPSTTSHIGHFFVNFTGVTFTHYLHRLSLYQATS